MTAASSVMHDFHQVRAWESAILVAVKVRKLAETFPRRGYTELREQSTRAAESISHNIAEGRAAASPKEFLRFLNTAARSASETASQLNLALEYGIASKKEVFAVMGTVICTRRMIRSLQDKIRTDLQRPKPRKRPRRK